MTEEHLAPRNSKGLLISGYKETITFKMDKHMPTSEALKIIAKELSYQYGQEAKKFFLEKETTRRFQYYKYEIIGA